MHSKIKNVQQYADPIFHVKKFPGEDEMKKRGQSAASSRKEIRAEIIKTKKAIEDERRRTNSIKQILETAKSNADKRSQGRRSQSNI